MTVLDVSVDVNLAALVALLECGVTIQYFDHHGSGDVPAHPGLQAVIDTTPDICTGILVDRWLGGAHRIWAIVAAFGDNIAQAARQLALPLALSVAQIDALQELGECLNYTAYGDSEADLIMHPAALYELLHRHAEPFAFIDAEPVLRILRDARRQDLVMAQQILPYACPPHGSIMVLPDAPWSRRVRGEYANLLAARYPGQAHAILTPNMRGGYTVSARAPLAAMRGADELCRLFPEGGGRPAAAGINHLPHDQLPAFIHAFEHAFEPSP